MSARYQLIVASSEEELEAEVNDALIEGWECQGGVCRTTERRAGHDDAFDQPYFIDVPLWSQAMIKRAASA